MILTNYVTKEQVVGVASAEMDFDFNEDEEEIVDLTEDQLCMGSEWEHSVSLI